MEMTLTLTLMTDAAADNGNESSYNKGKGLL